MKKCNACGKMNPKENLFCIECGDSLEDAIVVNSKNRIISNNKYLKYAGAVLLVILVIFVGNQILFAKSAGAQVMIGFLKMMSDDNQKGHMELSLETDDPTMEDIFKDILYIMDYEYKNMDYAVKAELLIKDESAFEGVLALQEHVIYVDLLDLYEDNFYYSDKMIETYLIQSSALRTYFKDFSLKGVDYKKYVNIMEEELGRDLFKKSGRVQLELNENNILDVMEAILEEAEDDEKLMKVLQKELVSIFTKMAKDDFELYEIRVEDWEEILDEIEDFKDFEDMYAQVISDMLESIEWEKDSSYQTAFDLTLSFDFNMFNTIKEMDFEFEVEDEVAINGKYKNESGYNFKTFKKEKGIDIEALLEDEEEMYDVSRDVLENLSDKIQKNKDLVKYIEATDFYMEMEAWYGIDGVEEMLELLLSNYVY